MELDEMKQKWQQFDKELKAAKILNEQLIRRMLAERSASAMDKIKSFEFFGACFCGALLLIFLLQYQRVGNTTGMIVAYMVTLASFAVTIIMSLYKLKRISQIDFSGNSVMDATKKIQRFRLFIARERLWSVVSAPVIITALFVLLFKWIHHKDFLGDPGPLIGRAILALVLMVAGTLLLYRKLYFAKISSILQNLKELESFKNE